MNDSMTTSTTGTTTCAAADPTSARAHEVRTLLARGEQAQAIDGDLWASRRWFELAYGLAERVGDVDAMACALLGLGGLWVHEQRTAAGSVLLTRLRHVLSLVDPQSSVGRRLRARLAGETDYRAGGHTAIVRVLDEATRAADPPARASALSLAHHCVLGPGFGTFRRALSQELIGESARTGRRSDLLMGLLWQTVDLLLDGDRHAGRRLAELRETLAAGDHLAVGYVVDAIDVMLAIRAGRLDAAERLAAACHERGQAAGDVDATGWYAAHLVAIRWYQGRLPELLPMLGDLVDSPTLSVADNSGLAALAAAAAVCGDRPTAEAALATLRGPDGKQDLGEVPWSSTWLVTMNGIAEAAHALDDPETSDRVYDLLSPFAALPMMVSLGVACFGSAHHALGVASLTTGRVDRAIEHLQAAVRDNLALGHRPAVIASRLRHAQARDLRGRPDDLRIAREERTAASHESAIFSLATPEYLLTSPKPHDRRPPKATCRRDGQQWRLEYAHRRALVPHSVGMLHIAVLLANPGQEIPALDLAAGLAALTDTVQSAGAAAAAAATTAAAPSAAAMPSAAAASGQLVLDPEAVRNYQRRITALRAEIEALDDDWDALGPGLHRSGRPARAAEARAELDWLTAELAAATGLHARPRAFTDDAERARLAVGKAIRRALAAVAKADPHLGEHLAAAIHTGVRCSYRP
jgi:hypothetical protein